MPISFFFASFSHWASVVLVEFDCIADKHASREGKVGERKRERERKICVHSDDNSLAIRHAFIMRRRNPSES